MAFALTDWKHTSRKAGDGRVLYPHQLRDDRYLAAVAYAIDYYERMVGRPRYEFQNQTLLEFFGDPKLARGIVACLGRTYLWHTPTFEETLPKDVLYRLRKQGLDSSALLRRYLYRYVNNYHDGFLLPTERDAVIARLSDELGLDAPTFERLLTLDAPENAVLTKAAGTPDAQAIQALYNYHSLETPLRYAESLRVTLSGVLWPMLRTVHNLGRRYGLAYTVEFDGAGIFSRTATIQWSGKRDALGSFRGSGRRLVRTLLRLLAAHPGAAVEGEAMAHVRGKTGRVVLDKRALRTLGAQTINVGDQDAWEAEHLQQWQTAWSRAFARGETGGWRLRRDPEPIISEKGVIVPDFGLQRGAQRAVLVLAQSAQVADGLCKPLESLGGRTLVVVSTTPQLAKKLSRFPAIVVPSEGMPTPRTLASALPSPTSLAEQHTTKWQRLESILDNEGFVDEQRIAEVLELKADDVEQAVRNWRSKEVTYVPGIGLCTSDTLTDIRALLQSERRRAA